MAPLLVMLVGWFVFRGLGAAGIVAVGESWSSALRLALALMFAFTALSHFLPRTRGDLVRMVPPRLPNPQLLVTLTGILEVFGAIGLLVPSLSRIAAYALAALLVALFPANVHAARAQLTIAGRAATPLVWRLPMQIFWVGALLWVARTPDS